MFIEENTSPDIASAVKAITQCVVNYWCDHHSMKETWKNISLRFGATRYLIC